MSKRHRPSLNLELMPSDVPGTVAHHVVRWGLLVILALLTYWAFPVVPGTLEVPQLSVGDIATTEIIAPFDFYVEKTQAEINDEGSRRAGQVPPIYEFEANVVDAVLARTDSVFATLVAADSVSELIESAAANGIAISQEQATYLIGHERLAAFHAAVRQLFSRELARGVAENALNVELHNEVIVRRGGSEGLARRDTLRTQRSMMEGRFSTHPDPDSSVADFVYNTFLDELFRPTLVRNTAEYERLQADARALVNSVKDTVKQDERIIDANEPVTARAADRLNALRARMLAEGLAEGTVGGTVGQVFTNALLLSVFWTLLLLYRPMIYNTLRQMLALTLLFAIVILGTKAGLLVLGDLPPELVPVPFAGMVATILFRGRVAMVATMVLAVLIGSQALYGGADVILIALIGGVAAAVSVRSVRRRNHFLVSAAVVAAAYLCVAFAIELRLEGEWVDVGMIGLRGGLNAVASAALVSTLLPLFESMSGITTDLTLLELSDPDRSLLRRLATEAPGTYAHSIAMANLCESACNSIGAHGLLARVGCYYHDIGKVKKPQYFVENQSGGTNPHDKLKPEVSAGIVRNHVRDGVQLADDKKLPEVVKNFIAEHHGTMEISFFLERAKNKAEDNAGADVEVEEYRYPGPKPRSVETAVAMLADGVEAAIRVLDEPNPERLRDAIDHIVNQRVTSGQLEDAPLTLAQLSQVREEFARVIGGTYHNRIDYPEGSGGLSSDWEATSEA